MSNHKLVAPKAEARQAMQFTGVDSVAEIDNWLDEALTIEMRRGALALQHVPATEDTHLAEGLVKGGDVEHLAIFTIGGRHRADVGDWIVLDPVTIFKIVRAGDFDAGYDIVGGL